MAETIDKDAEVRRAADALLSTLWQLAWSGSRTHEENWAEMDRRWPQARWLHNALKLATAPPECEHDWFDCSNAAVPPPAKSCRKCGWTVGDDETRGFYILWPWLQPDHVTITTSGAAIRQKSDVPTDVNDMPEGE